MPSTYSFSFFTMDPGNPPAPNTVLNPTTLTVIDQNDNGSIGTSQGDTVGGFAVTNVWVDDTVTVRVDGQDVQMTGVTFYRSGAPAVFMPTDGTILTGSIFQSSTFVVTSTEYSLPPVPCFTAGTMIFTAQGARPVETLEPGDLILTRDSGMRPLRWIAQTTVCGLDRFAPIRFMAGTVGNTRQLMVSPNHRMLVTGWKAEMYFGEQEVLVPAKTLVNGDTIMSAPCQSVTYVHLLLDRHEVIFAEGAATESLHPGDYLLAGADETAAEILALFPELETEPGRRKWKSARSIARTREAKLLAA
ncbi:MAG: Hint domain-containing protein [Paracoccaceae bacterium]|jgi:hypothetical protein|nr:Hint domain-containing protein [Paracoccaceae bacterium]